MFVAKRMRFPLETILVGIRWYAACPLSYRHLEGMMHERGILVDHSSIIRWTIWFLPLLGKIFRKHKRQVSGSWRMDKTYIKVKGVWKYLYCAVDKKEKTIDFLLTAKHDTVESMRFIEKAIQDNGTPERLAMDKSSTNKWAIDQIIEDKDISIIVRHIKHLNNVVEQDHNAVKRSTKPKLNLKSFRASKNVLPVIELMHMIRKGQLNIVGAEKLSFADQFYALAGEIRPALV